MELVPVFNPASPLAKVIVDFSKVILALCGVILAIVTGLITWCLIRFRAQPGVGEPRQTVGNKPIEFTWTAIPLLLVMGIFVLTARAMSRSDPVPKGNPKPDLVVVGHQWWWEARYPDSGAVTANEIHIPAGRRVLVRVESADVIHDFWPFRLGRKIDAVPGQPNHLWLQADQPGTYLGTCAEYCGNQHAWMWFRVIAQPAAEFEAWQRRQLQPANPASASAMRGAQVFRQMTCVNCHALEATPAAKPQAAPDLNHLADRQTLAGGVLQNTPSNLARWLKDPQAIKPGSLMPNLHLTDAQVADLVSYLEGEKNGTTAETGGTR